MFTKRDMARVRPEMAERIEESRVQIIQRGHDGAGRATDFLTEDLVGLAIAAYVLDGSVEGFRQQIAEATRLHIGLFRRFHAGAPLRREGDHKRPNAPPVATSLSAYVVSNEQHWAVFDALAGAQFKLAEELSALMGSVPSYDIANAYCFMLKHILANEPAAALPYVDALARVVPKKEKEPLVQMFRQIASPQPDPAEVQRLIVEIERSHQRDVRNEAPFIGGTERELLCMWGIALANLARYKGIIDHVEFSSEYIPTDLVV